MIQLFGLQTTSDEKCDGLLTSGISRGTLRTRMPCRTMDLGCSKERTGAPSWTSVEVKLEDWDCLSRSLRVEVFNCANSLQLDVLTLTVFRENKNTNSLNWILITASSRSKCVGPLHACK